MIRPVALCLLLAACAHTPAAEPVVVTQRVEVPVAVACGQALPTPAYADTDAALASASDIYERVKLLLAGREQRDQVDREQIASSVGCAAP